MYLCVFSSNFILYFSNVEALTVVILINPLSLSLSLSLSKTNTLSLTHTHTTGTRKQSYASCGKDGCLYHKKKKAHGNSLMHHVAKTGVYITKKKRHTETVLCIMWQRRVFISQQGRALRGCSSHSRKFFNFKFPSFFFLSITCIKTVCAL